MTPFFTLFVLSRSSDNTTSQNIGGDGCMGRPPPQILFGGTVPPVPPRSTPLVIGIMIAMLQRVQNKFFEESVFRMHFRHRRLGCLRASFKLITDKTVVYRVLIIWSSILLAPPRNY